MARSGVIETDKGYRKIMREMRALDNTEITVGIHADAGSDGEGVRNVDKGFWNEYGTETEDGQQLIPERSFLRAAFDENRADIDTTIDRLWDGVKLGKLDATRAAGILGTRHEGQVKRKARTGPFTPNAESTIARKGSSKPLTDSGEMINSIRYEVK